MTLCFGVLLEDGCRKGMLRSCSVVLLESLMERRREISRVIYALLSVWLRDGKNKADSSPEKLLGGIPRGERCELPIY
jgi:hypothetical protein